MNEGFLVDENMPIWWRGAIVRLQPHLQVWRIGDPGALPKESPDPLLLDWCEANNCYLVTNNRRTMPQHLAAFNKQGRHVPGIFIVDPRMNIKELAVELSLIVGASLPDEYQDQFRHLPLS